MAATEADVAEALGPHSLSGGVFVGGDETRGCGRYDKQARLHNGVIPALTPTSVAPANLIHPMNPPTDLLSSAADATEASALLHSEPDIRPPSGGHEVSHRAMDVADGPSLAPEGLGRRQGF